MTTNKLTGKLPATLIFDAYFEEGKYLDHWVTEY
jgi:hypothetical protein